MTATPLDRLLADLDAPVRRVVLARGVAAHRGDDGAWRLPPTPHDDRSDRDARAATPRPAEATLSALGLRPVSRDARDDVRAPAARETPVDPVAVGTRHGLAPLLLVTGAPGGESTHLVSAAGALGWHPPLDRLYDDPALGRRALRLRFVLDAIEHHAAHAAEAYAATSAEARRAAALFGACDLATLAGQPALSVELDALLAAARRAYVDGARLLAEAFPARRARDPEAGPPSFDTLVLGARSAPAELRERLLDAWETHGAHARAYRHALRRRDAAELGRAPVQLARLACGVWAVSVPVPAPRADGPRRRVDALERAWAIATDAMRVVSLVVYAASER